MTLVVCPFNRPHYVAMGHFHQLLEPKQTAADLSSPRYSKSNALSFTYRVLRNIYEHIACQRDI